MSWTTHQLTDVMLGCYFSRALPHRDFVKHSFVNRSRPGEQWAFDLGYRQLRFLVILTCSQVDDIFFPRTIITKNWFQIGKCPKSKKKWCAAWELMCVEHHTKTTIAVTSNAGHSASQRICLLPWRDVHHAVQEKPTHPKKRHTRITTIDHYWGWEKTRLIDKLPRSIALLLLYCKTAFVCV